MKISEKDLIKSIMEFLGFEPTEKDVEDFYSYMERHHSGEVKGYYESNEPVDLDTPDMNESVFK